MPDNTPAPPSLRVRDVAGLIGSGRLDVAAGLALAALDQRTAALDEAAAAAAVIRSYQAALAGVTPLRDAPRRLPRPNERGAAAFAELCNLLHAQDAQLDELHAMLAELT